MRIKPELKGALLALLGVVLLLAGLWIFTGLRLGIWTYHEYDRYVWLTANLEVAHKLWLGDINAGNNVEELIKVWRPHEINRFGRWIELRWFPGGPSHDAISLIGIWVLARDGVLVSASFYADDGLDQRSFFNTLTPVATTEYQAALKEYVDGLRAEHEKSVSSVNVTNLNQPFRSETNQSR